MIKAKPYCCDISTWLDSNYGIRLDDVPFCVCRDWEHMNRVYAILKRRHPDSHWSMCNKTKGVY